MTCEASRKRTFSPASADGLTPCGSPDGPMTDLFGQALPPASRSASQARGLETPTPATSRRSGCGSSPSRTLSLSLASNLAKQLEKGGSTLFSMRWSILDTPAGRPYFRLVASERRTFDSGYTLPRKSWTTPQAHDTTGRSLTQKAIHGTKHGCACLVRQAEKVTLAARGLAPVGLNATTDSARLNPDHSRWLMGFPPEWCDCAVTATQSTLSLPRLLSKPRTRPSKEPTP